jgi:hypothetical protein
MKNHTLLLPILPIAIILLALSSGPAAGQGDPFVYLPFMTGDGGGQPPPSPDPVGPNAAWGTVPSPNLGPAENILTDIAAIDSQDVWAIGTAGNDPLALHWDGDSWNIIPVPELTYDTQLNGITAVSTNDVWAAGAVETGVSSNTDTLIMHWNGTEWSVIPSPNGNPNGRNKLNAIAAVAANDIWAVGEYTDNISTRPLILHWDGSDWTIAPQDCDLYNSLLAVTVIAPDDIWATGYALTCHYDGSSWTEIPSPQPRPAFNEIGYTLNDIDAVSTDDIWVVGSRSISTGQAVVVASLAEHWNGSQWTAVYNQFPILGNGVVALAADNIWAVGSSIAHWDGSSWRVVPNPVVGEARRLIAIDAVGDYDLWSAGYFLNETYTEQTLIENAPSKTQGTVRGDTNNSSAVITWLGPVNGSTEADMFGEYGAAGLPAGTYTFIASAPGCTPETAEITVTAGTTTFQDFTLDC